MTSNSNSVLVIGDIHIKSSNHKEINDLFDIISSTIKKLSPNFIVLLGDTLDRFGKIDMRSQCLATKMILSFSEYCPVFVLIGNHDRINNEVFCTDVSPFLQLKISPLNNVIIVDSPLEKNGFLFVPYVPKGRFNEAIRKYNLNSIKAVFAHQEFKGCEYSGMKSTDGDNWDVKNPLVISGHIHKKQQPSKNIYYVGTPIQVSVDEDEDKYLHMFTFDNTIDIKRIKVGIPPKICMKLKLPLDNNIIEILLNKKGSVEVSGFSGEIDAFKISPLYKSIKENTNIRLRTRKIYKVEKINKSIKFLDILIKSLTKKEQEIFKLLIEESS